jgi:hypothetical protein
VVDEDATLSEQARQQVREAFVQPRAGWPGNGNPCRRPNAIAVAPPRPVGALRELFLRKEVFGGLLYDPTSGFIYKADAEAFGLIERLIESRAADGLREMTLEKAAESLASDVKHPAKDIAYLLHDLRSFGIW